MRFKVKTRPEGSHDEGCLCGVARQIELPDFAIAECKHFDARQADVPRGASADFATVERGRLELSVRSKQARKMTPDQRIT